MRNRFTDSTWAQFRRDKFAKEYGRLIQRERFQVHWWSKSQVKHRKFLVVPEEQSKELVHR